MKNFTLVWLNFIIIPLLCTSVVEERLAPYKSLLENGTYEGQDWSHYDQKPLSRYETFKYAFEYFEQHNGKIIVELGTSRSFTHGGLPGCNTNNIKAWTPNNPQNWDWGAGFFTRMAVQTLSHCNPEMYTIDIARDHIWRCKIMTEPFQHFMKYHVCSSLDFLARCNFGRGIDLLYMDTGDMTPIEPTAQLQLAEAKLVVERNLIAPGGLILIDDVRNQTPKKFGETSNLGKSKYSLPYLLQNGFEIVVDGYQIVLHKK